MDDKRLRKLQAEITKLKKENAQLKKLLKKFELQIEAFLDIINNEEEVSLPNKNDNNYKKNKMPKPKFFKEQDGEKSN